jgi:hypothetical protein
MTGSRAVRPHRLRALALLACLCCLAALVAAPAAGAFIYWSANATNLMRSANDGSGLGFFVPTAPYSDAVAIDGSHVYWTSSDGRIGRANLDGTGANPNFITGLPSYLPGLAVNATTIYWSSLTSIGRAKIDGTEVEPNFLATNHATGLALDSHYLYWGENELGRIDRAALDGSGGVDTKFISAPGDPCSVAVDSSYVYWSDATGNSVGRAKINGSGAEPAFINPGAAVDCGVAVSPSYVYFGINGYPGPSSMARANLDGSGLLTSFFSLAPYGGPFVQMAVDSLAPSPVLPSNVFNFLGQARDKRHGTARLKLRVPGPGTLVLSGRGLWKATRHPTGAATLVLLVRPRGSLAAKLAKRGKALATAKLTFTPVGGTAATQTRHLWLLERR